MGDVFHRGVHRRLEVLDLVVWQGVLDHILQPHLLRAVHHILIVLETTREEALTAWEGQS